MTEQLSSIKAEMKELMEDWKERNVLAPGDVFVVGCSTSEIAGEHIGTAGNEQIASVLFEAFLELKKSTGIELAFQGCEHINRSLVIEKSLLQQRSWEQVSVIPVRKAGGSMAAYAYQHMENPVVVEEIQADAGIDIGDTFIGMHLKRVAVPIRLNRNDVGKAHVTAATTRPKLVGGNRAVYQQEDVESTLCD